MRCGLLSLALCAGCAGTFGGPDDVLARRIQYGLEAVAIAASACDGGETTQYLHESRWVETNPILGAHPSDASVWAYLGTIDAIMVGADYLIDRYVRPPWGSRVGAAVALGVTGSELWADAYNMHIGAGFCGVDPGGPWQPLRDGEPGSVSSARSAP